MYRTLLMPSALAIACSSQWLFETQTAQVTPFQSLNLSMSGLLSELQTVLGWRAQQEAALDARQAAAAAARRRQRLIPGGPALWVRRRPRLIPGGRR